MISERAIRRYDGQYLIVRLAFGRNQTALPDASTVTLFYLIAAS